MSKSIEVKAVAGFVLTGRAPVEEGEVLVLDRHLALELIHAQKAERYVRPAAAPAEEPAPIEQEPEPTGKGSRRNKSTEEK